MHFAWLQTRTLSRLGLILAIATATLAQLLADELRYRDGNVALGKLISSDQGVIVFSSSRFGKLRVSADEAYVVREQPPAVDNTARSAMQPGAVDAEGKKRSHWWNSWEGRLAFSAELLDDERDRDEWLLELRMERRWAADEVRFEPRYEFKREADTTQNDLLKVRGYWRHDFPKRLFGLYKPYLERNRQYVLEGFNADYLLVQHLVGGGVRLLDKAKTQVRMGVAEGLFLLRFDVNPDAIEIWADSIFFEAEIKLPLGWSLREQGQWVHYRSIVDDDGWTNDLELSKLFTETLSVGLRYEYRHNAPEFRVTNYSKLRLLLGYSF